MIQIPSHVFENDIVKVIANTGDVYRKGTIFIARVAYASPSSITIINQEDQERWSICQDGWFSIVEAEAPHDISCF